MIFSQRLLCGPLVSSSLVQLGAALVRTIILSCVFSVFVSCKSGGAQGESEKDREASRAAAEQAAAALTGSEVPSKKKVEVKAAPAPIKKKVLGHSRPVGPALVIVPGKGVGAIRFGATFKTIERHMGAPCDQKSETRCLYVRQAIEFFMKDGAVVRMKVQRRNRDVTDPPKGADKKFGIYRGAIPPKITMNLHRHIVIEEFGEPQRKEALAKPGPNGLVDRHFYDGLVFEYDKIENGNVILAAIEILPSKTASPLGPSLQKEADKSKKVKP